MFNFKTTFIPLLASVVAIAIWVFVVDRDERLTDAKVTTEAERYITTLSTSLELALEKRLAVFAGVKSFVDHNLREIGLNLDADMKSRLDSFVGSQFESISGIRNFSLAPNGLQSWVFPLEGNHAVLGHDLFNDPSPDSPENIHRALKSGKRTISGPYQLRQGGFGLIVRQAVYVDQKVWGMVAMVIDIPPILKVSKIELALADYITGLRTNKAVQFWGGGAAFSKQAIISKINLPDGFWEIGIVPNKRISEQVAIQTLWVKVYTGIFLFTIVAFLFFFLRRQQMMEKEVTKNTSAVQFSETRFKNFAESASDWLWEMDENFNYTYVSARYFKITGFDPNKLADYDYKDLLNSTYDEKESGRWTALFEKVQKHTPFRHFEYQTLSADKQVLHISVSGSPRFDADGKFLGYRGTGIDITERKLVEEENKIYAELFTKWKTSNFIGIAQCGPDGQIIDVNDVFLSTLGYSREELASGCLDWQKLTPKEYYQLDANAMDEAEAKGSWTAYEKEYFHKKGHRVPILIGGTLYKKEPQEYIEFILDISEQKKNESVLALATKKAEAATRAKSEFLAAMSHEIRTPMAGIVGMADLLVGSDLTGQNLNWAMNVRSSGLTLLKILNEILDQSKLEAGMLEIAPIDFHLPTLIQEIVDLFHPNVEAKGLSLTLELADRLPENVHADRMRIGQVLSNLLSNALKFTETGGISVMVTHERSEIGELTLSFTVADSGIGLTESEKSRIFNVFSQADSSTSRNYGGTGLGLSISQNLARLMGGEIDVNSTKGEGATFCCKIRCRPAEHEIEIPTGMPSKELWKASRRLKILLADDNYINQQLIVAIFYNLGHELVVVDDGQAAIDSIEAQDFDIVLMDVRMPIIDGLEATAAIRAMDNEKSNIPIIAITADIVFGNIKAYREAGMNDVCFRPIEMSALLKVINSQMREEIHTPVRNEEPSQAATNYNTVMLGDEFVITRS